MAADPVPKRSPWPLVALVAAGGVLVYVVVAVLASIGLPGLNVPFARSNAPQMHSIDRSAPAGDLQSAELRLSYGATMVTVTSADTGGDLYRAHFEVTDNVRTTTSLNTSSGVLTINLHTNRWFCFACDQRSSLRLTLSDRLPWKLALTGGASSGDLDLRSLKLTGLQVAGGASHVSVQLPAPSGEVPIKFEGGATSVELGAPAGTQARIEVGGGASSLHVNGADSSSLGHELRYQSEGFPAAHDRYIVNASGGASSINWSS